MRSAIGRTSVIQQADAGSVAAGATVTARFIAPPGFDSRNSIAEVWPSPNVNSPEGFSHSFTWDSPTSVIVSARNNSAAAQRPYLNVVFRRVKA